MGLVYTTIKLRNIIANSAAVELEGKVDTGVTLLVLIVEPRRLGIYPNPRSVLPMAEVE